MTFTIAITSKWFLSSLQVQVWLAKTYYVYFYVSYSKDFFAVRIVENYFFMYISTEFFLDKLPPSGQILHYTKLLMQMENLDLYIVYFRWKKHYKLNIFKIWIRCDLHLKTRLCLLFVLIITKTESRVSSCYHSKLVPMGPLICDFFLVFISPLVTI